MIKGMDRKDGGDDPIKWRGGEISRVEGLTDGMFAFAITLIVVSLQVPKTYADLVNGMRGIVSFLVCFAMMMWVWHNHYTFFRRYGLTDGATITLNAVLGFVVLYYVYPLKFLADCFMAFVNPWFLGNAPRPITTYEQLTVLFVLYGVGFIAIFALFAALYGNAARRHEFIGLTETERQLTRLNAFRYLGIAGVGVLSIILIVTTHTAMLAGPIYCLIGVVEGWHGRASRKLQAQAAV